MACVCFYLSCVRDKHICLHSLIENVLAELERKCSNKSNTISSLSISTDSILRYLIDVAKTAKFVFFLLIVLLSTKYRRNILEPIHWCVRSDSFLYTEHTLQEHQPKNSCKKIRLSNDFSQVSIGINDPLSSANGLFSAYQVQVKSFRLVMH